MQDAPFRPLLDRVLIRKIEPEPDENGFVIPEKFRQRNHDGIVVALGHGVVLGKEFRPLTEFLSVGDKILFGEYTAEHLELDGDDTYYIVRIQDIRGAKSK